MPRQSPRRWRTPPPIIHGPESLDAAPVLDEFDPELAALLWASSRDVALYFSADVDTRVALFHGAAAQSRAASIERIAARLPIAVDLHVAASVVAGSAESSQVSRACRSISGWALRRSSTGTALAFMQAAALADPASPDLAYRAGELAAGRGEPARAESWLRRAVMLARRTRSRSVYARALLALGDLHRDRDHPFSARRYYDRAVRAASRYSLLSVEEKARAALQSLTSADQPSNPNDSRF